MKIKKTKLIGFLLALFTLSMMVNASCVIDLQDPEKSAHVVVESCANVGVFSVGTYYAEDWESLTYRYPKPWKGTYLTLKIDGVLYSNSRYSVGAQNMDSYVVIGPKVVGSDRVYTKWSLPEGIDVEQSLILVEGGAVPYVRVVNRCGSPIEVSGRLSLDLMVDGNDGAPVFVPGRGVMSTEFSYSGSQLDFDYVVAQDHAEHPGLTREIGLSYGETKASKVVFGNWKTSRSPVSWEYDAVASRSTELDSALLVYYGPENVAADQAFEFGLSYGVEAEAATCADGVQNQGETGIDCGGPCDPCVTGTTAPTQTTAPGDKDESQFPVTYLILFLVVVLIALLAFVFMPRSKAAKPKAALAKPVAAKPKAPAAKPAEPKKAAAAPSKPAKGQVLIEKQRKGDKVNITVKNSSNEALKNCVLIESVPSDADIKFIVGKNVNRKRSKLLWNIGELAAGAKVVLEYTSSSDKKSKVENFSFLSTNPVFAKISE